MNKQIDCNSRVWSPALRSEGRVLRIKQSFGSDGLTGPMEALVEWDDYRLTSPDWISVYTLKAI